MANKSHKRSSKNIVKRKTRRRSVRLTRKHGGRRFSHHANRARQRMREAREKARRKMEEMRKKAAAKKAALAAKATAAKEKMAAKAAAAKEKMAAASRRVATSKVGRSIARGSRKLGRGLATAGRSVASGTRRLGQRIGNSGFGRRAASMGRGLGRGTMRLGRAAISGTRRLGRLGARGIRGATKLGKGVFKAAEHTKDESSGAPESSPGMEAPTTTDQQTQEAVTNISQAQDKADEYVEKAHKENLTRMNKTDADKARRIAEMRLCCEVCGDAKDSNIKKSRRLACGLGCCEPTEEEKSANDDATVGADNITLAHAKGNKLIKKANEENENIHGNNVAYDAIQLARRKTCCDVCGKSTGINCAQNCC